MECGKLPLRGDFKDGLVEVDEASELDVEVRFKDELGVGAGPVSWLSGAPGPGSISPLSSYACSFGPRSGCRRFALSRFDSLFRVFSVGTMSGSWEGLS